MHASGHRSPFSYERVGGLMAYIKAFELSQSLSAVCLGKAQGIKEVLP